MHNPFISKTFQFGEVFENMRDQAPVRIDDWLNSLTGPGIGLAVVGYVMQQDRVLITVKRWKLADTVRPAYGAMARPVPTTIDETFEDPSIQVGETEG